MVCVFCAVNIFIWFKIVFRPHPEDFLCKMKLDVFRRLNLHIRFTWGTGVRREQLTFHLVCCYFLKFVLMTLNTKWERKNNRVIWKGRLEVLWALDSLSRSLIKKIKEDGVLLNEQNTKTRPTGLAQTIWNLQAGLQPATCTWPKENDFYCSARLPPGRPIYSLPR